jgi:hypothetical protein
MKTNRAPFTTAGIGLALLGGLLLTAGCDEGYGKKAGNQVDDVAEDVKDVGEDIGDKAEDAVDNAEDVIDESK